MKTKQANKAKSLIEAARNPKLVTLEHRSFRVEYFVKGQEKPSINRRYLRIDTAVPAAMKFIVMAGMSGDHIKITHAEFKFDIASIYVRGVSIELVWAADLLNVEA